MQPNTQYATIVVLEMTDDPSIYIPVRKETVEYHGPWALADRAAQAQARTNVNTANTVTGQAGANAGQDRGLLTAAYRNDVNSPTGYTGEAQNKMLTAAEAGAGGATAGLTGAVGLAANRTHNTGNTSALLDTLARGKQQAAAGSSEKIAADSEKLAQQKRAQALSGTQNMYGEDTSAQLKAMGLSNEAINTEVNAGKSGWLQDVEGGMKAVGDLRKAFAPQPA